jgi:hypothetical protein
MARKAVMRLNSRIDARMDTTPPLKQLYSLSVVEKAGRSAGISWYEPEFTAAGALQDEALVREGQGRGGALRAPLPRHQGRGRRRHRRQRALRRCEQRGLLKMNIELALALVATAPVLAFDIETTGLDNEARVCGYAVSDGAQAVYVPVRHLAGNVACAPERFERRLNLAFP